MRLPFVFLMRVVDRWWMSSQKIQIYGNSNMDYDLWAFIISFLSLIVAGIALGWNIFRDCVNKPKLKLNMFIADWYDPHRGEMPQVISVSITNTGKQPIVIKAHGFSMKDKTTSIFPELMHYFDQKRLEPYDRLDITFPHAILQTLVEKAENISAFLVCDTTGRKWKLDKKIFNEFKKNLLSQKKTSKANKSSA